MDFTQSNDNQKKGPKSLHRLTAESKAKALASIDLLDRVQQLSAAADQGAALEGSSLDMLNIDITDEAILNGLNEYQKVILSVGSIIAEYDTNNKQFPVMGFGAKVLNAEGRYQLNHCFPLTSNGSFVVSGLAGVMNAYHDM